MTGPERERSAETSGVAEAVSDEELAGRAASGDAGAFGELVSRYEGRVYWTALKVVGNREDARDIAQEAFVRVFQALDSFDTSRSFFSWLFRIVTNLGIDFLRKNKRSVVVDELGYIPDERRTPKEEAEAKDMREKVQEVLQTLPDLYRTIIVLCDIEEISCKEAAEILDINHGTARWRLHHARGLFKESWESKFGEGDYDL